LLHHSLEASSKIDFMVKVNKGHLQMFHGQCKHVFLTIPNDDVYLMMIVLLNSFVILGCGGKRFTKEHVCVIVSNFPYNDGERRRKFP
jgi:hypothetical protein